MSKTDQLDKTDIVILRIFFGNEKKTPMNSITINEFMELTKSDKQCERIERISYAGMYRRINALIQKGMIAKGIKDKNSNAYYISKKGCEIFTGNKRKTKQEE